METMLTGGCLCGAVRYECSAKPMMTGNCHCRDCQKSSGAPFVTAMAVPASALKISGDVKYYEIKADSGNAFSRGFCPECGARLFAKSSGMPSSLSDHRGKPDDPSQFRPAMDFIFSAPLIIWIRAPKFAKMPT